MYDDWVDGINNVYLQGKLKEKLVGRAEENGNVRSIGLWSVC